MYMIRGRYLSSMDDLGAVLALRRQVFDLGADESDRMAVYALAMDQAGEPAGAGRLYIDGDDHFRMDLVGVLPEKRRQGLGDLILRMLLQRALDLNAPAVVIDAPRELHPFFARYGFAAEGASAMRATPSSIDACGGCGGKCCPR